jgi:hypothetical protein
MRLLLLRNASNAGAARAGSSRVSPDDLGDVQRLTKAVLSLEGRSSTPVDVALCAFM